MRTMKKIVEKIKDKMHDIWETLVFWVGDIRSLSTFPWVTWARPGHLMDFDESALAMHMFRAGDVGLHRYKGYVSNLAIPGYMKHAWIHTTDGDIPNPQIVEAVSEGVFERNATNAVWCDYSMVLRPIISKESKMAAVEKAREIVGENYDVDFKFDIEKELEYYKNGTPIGKYDPAFSCTEVCGYSYWHEKDTLGIKRVSKRGKEILVPDNFINMGWEIVWVSESVTLESAIELGLHSEGLAMLKNFLQ
jgi:hypothetical protein